ncbi:ABC transporter ATP-binding protein [Candidatus Dependentiae bacterium]|nr:ABC transporter ATP-binding protein [Candidatus Dependentiae bacterium]
MNTSSVLVVQNLTKIFPGKSKVQKPFTAVDNISFSIGEGEILGLLGPNGAGKTTTIHMLLGTLTATAGSVTVFGKNFLTHHSEVLQEVGFASTYINFPANLSVQENLTIHGMLYGLTGAVLRQRIARYLEKFHATGFARREVGTLSAGQKTRVMLVKAFMTEPKLLLLDEPTASLDPDVACEVREFILHEQQSRKLSILFTSHNMDEVATVCQRVLVLQNGKIIANDAPAVLAASISRARVQLVIVDGLKRLIAYAQRENLAYTVKERWIEVEVNEQSVAQFIMQVAQCGVQFSHIAIEKPTLEDYFLQIARAT